MRQMTAQPPLRPEAAERGTAASGVQSGKRAIKEYGSGSRNSGFFSPAAEAAAITNKARLSGLYSIHRA